MSGNRGDRSIKGWRMAGIALTVFTVCCLALGIAIATSDGGDSLQFKNMDMAVKKDKWVDPIDWEKLKRQNGDIYAWIEIPGTAVDNPVLQSSDGKPEDYYMNHYYMGDYGIAGSIYSRKGTAEDFSDPVTVIYGHNMVNGSMFAGIRNFEDPDFFQKHDTITIYLQGRILSYRIMAYYVGGREHIQETWHPEREDGVLAYGKEILSGRHGGCRRKNEKLTASGKILTLSTCSSGNSRRYLQGILMGEQRTE